MKDEVGSLGWEDTLQEGMATHSTILIWRILWTEEPGGLQSIGLHRIGHEVTQHAKTAKSNPQPQNSHPLLWVKYIHKYKSDELLEH